MIREGQEMIYTGLGLDEPQRRCMVVSQDEGGSIFVQWSDTKDFALVEALSLIEAEPEKRKLAHVRNDEWAGLGEDISPLVSQALDEQGYEGAATVLSSEGYLASLPEYVDEAIDSVVARLKNETMVSTALNGIEPERVDELLVKTVVDLMMSRIEDYR